MTPRYVSVMDLLLERLGEHESAEAEVLRCYEAAAATAPDPAVRFLMNLILEDEKRHHGWMAAAARSVRELQSENEATSLPVLQAASEMAQSLLDQTDSFLDAENQALNDLRQLERTINLVQTNDRALYNGVELSHSPRTTAWIKDSPLDVLVEVMREDTRRHIRILESIKKRLQRRSRNGVHAESAALSR